MRAKTAWQKTAAVLLAVVLLSGCEIFRTIPAGHSGVVFSALPTFLGGGIRSKVLVSGEKEFILPWETLYLMNTTPLYLTWGGKGEGTEPSREDYVETRTLDGNEVGLAVTVSYRVLPEQLPYIVQKVGTTDDDLQRLVAVTARTDIRTHLNVLKTREFFSPSNMQQAFDRVKGSLNSRLKPEGIEILNVSAIDRRFERRKANGEVDDSYERLIDDTYALSQQTEQAQKRIETVVEQKRREYAETQGKVNRQIAEVNGYAEQAKLRGNGYLERKRNEAEQISTVGGAQVQGLRKQIEALSGPGGAALLRLAIVEELVSKKPKFVLVSSPDDRSGINISRVDTNDLVRQLGLFNASERSEPVTQHLQDAIAVSPVPGVEGTGVVSGKADATQIHE